MVLMWFAKYALLSSTLNGPKFMGTRAETLDEEGDYDGYFARMLLDRIF